MVEKDGEKIMIWAFSRDRAELDNPAEQDHVIISITDIGSQDAEPALTTETLAILRLQFDNLHQVIGPGFKIQFGRDVVYFTREMADEVVSFLRKYKWRDLICHCEAGASRSVAMAYSVSNFYGMDYENKLSGLGAHHVGNPLVYHLMLDALRHPLRPNEYRKPANIEIIRE